jgi:4-hydroxybenzoate polyprenyltransferase
MNLPNALLKCCRPRQWSKNLLVYASALFSFQIASHIWINSTLALISFCLISSCIYLVNDVIDINADRLHPTKKNRPIASGLVSSKAALITAAILFVASISIALLVNPGLVLIIIGYTLIQFAYCLQLKREPLLDIFCIASGFLLRALAGLVATGLGSSPWFLLCVGLLALFLAVEKRKAELRVSLDRGVVTRRVLNRYSLPLLQRLESLVSSSAFMAYALWSAGPTLQGAPTSWMLLTVPFVLVGIFRYQLLSDPEEIERRTARNPEQTTEKPEEILLGDRGIRLTLVGWMAMVVVIGMGHRLGWLA